MRSAPSVSYPIGTSSLLRTLLVLLTFLGCCGLLLGIAYGLGRWTWLVALAWMAWTLWAWRIWQRQPLGRLAWEAFAQRRAKSAATPPRGQWRWLSNAYLDGVVLLKVERVHDLQSTVLLRLHNPDGARTWVWVERASDPQRWDDLRRALWEHC